MPAALVSGQRLVDRHRGLASQAAVPRDFAVFSHDNFGRIHFHFQIFDRLDRTVGIGPGDAIVLDKRFAQLQRTGIFWGKSDKDDVRVFFEFLIGLNQALCRLVASASPVSPNIDHDDLVFQIGRTGAGAIEPAFRQDGGHRFPDGQRRVGRWSHS